jgi:hypothetical protein
VPPRYFLELVVVERQHVAAFDADRAGNLAALFRQHAQQRRAG